MDGIYWTGRVHTVENSYCVADYNHVFNEGKLVGCPTAVPGLMKYRLEAGLISSFSTRPGRVCTEESDSYVHSINGLGQNAVCNVRNFSLTEIRTALPAVSILHSSAIKYAHP